MLCSPDICHARPLRQTANAPEAAARQAVTPLPCALRVSSSRAGQARSLDRLTQAAIACVCWGAEAALGGAWESGQAPPCFFYVKM